MECFKGFVELADWAWDRVAGWKPLAQDTLGKQLIRAADSVGANMVEGAGRHSDPDAIRFFVIARASARETRYWLERAARRRLLTQDEAALQIEKLDNAARLLNLLIRYRRGRPADDRVSDGFASYDALGAGDEAWDMSTP
jgi:four helix bundle protein